MKNITRISVSLFVLLISALAQMPSPPQFSADMTMTSPRQHEQMAGKMFFDKGKMRMDMNTHGQNMSMISDSATQTSYMIMHAQRMYMEIHGTRSPMGRGPQMPDVKQFSENPCASEKNTTCRKVGTETVNGRVCDKWEFTSTNASENRTAWIDQKTHIPIKTVNADGTTMEFTNFKEGPQDASHFEVPAGYQKMDMGMMGGRRPGGD